MTKEENFLLQVLSDYLNSRKTPEQNGLDWNALILLMRKHQIGGIVFYQCGDFMPQNVRAYAEKEYSASVYYYMNRQADMEELDEIFRKAEIPYFIVKGLVVSKYYPVPELRTMGDTDIVVHSEDRPKVRDILLQNGFKKGDIYTETEWHYTHHGMDYELHDHLLYDEVVNEGEFKSFINDYWSYVQDDKLDVSFHFLFLLIHLRKHLMNTGIGFRQFMDVAVMAKNEKNLNWSWIHEKLSELHLLPFASVCFGFIRRWFDISVPIETREPEDSFYKYATESILANGVFGFDNKENGRNRVINDTTKNQNSRGSIVLSALSSIFPSYKIMRHYEHYEYLDGRPYLLPVAYVHRIIRGIRYYPQKKHYMEDFLPSEEKVHERQTYLKNWGLR